MSKFKKGDEVRVLQSYGKALAGKILTVLRLDGHACWFAGENCHDFIISNGHLELCENKKCSSCGHTDPNLCCRESSEPENRDLTLEKEIMARFESTNPLDAQEGGDHYKNMKIQPIEFAQANNLPACEYSVVKYICRHKNKDKIKDLKKAIHFIKLLAKLEYDVEL